MNWWMDKENVVYVHNVVLFSHKEKNYIIYRNMDRAGDHHVKWNKPDSEKQTTHIFFHMWSIYLKNKTKQKIGAWI
jgi:hypothetical protein